MSTNVPVPVLTATGYSIPTMAQILQGVVQDMLAAFGPALNLSWIPQANGQPNSSLSTPQGQLATSWSAAIFDCYSQFLAIASQVDPQYAQGLMQDGIGNIYFMTRYPATGTQVPGTVTGLAGTVIPTFQAVATDASGNLYSCSVAGGAATIAVGGTQVIFTNLSTGPVAFVGPMTISLTTPGWDAISISPGVVVVLGSNIESTQQFETRRQGSVAINANGIAASIKAAILALTPTSIPGSVYVVDNPSSVSITQGGIVLPPNSVYVAAYNFPAYAPWTQVNTTINGVITPTWPISSVAQAIFAKKSLGCSYAPSAIINGTVTGVAPLTLTVNSTSSGQVALGQTLLNAAFGGVPYMNGTTPVVITGGSAPNWTMNLSPGTITAATLWLGTTNTVVDPTYPTPQPSYNITFTIPVQVPINIQVTLAQASNPPQNAQTLLQASTGLPLAFSGLDGYPPVSQIGATVFASRFYTTVAQTIPGASIVSILVGTGSPTLSQQPININQIPIIGTINVVYV